MLSIFVQSALSLTLIQLVFLREIINYVSEMRLYVFSSLLICLGFVVVSVMM